jgi:hypothetical protein
MSQELISTWLGLDAGEWPPSHYRLLGLAPGESNANLIEERVHQHLDTVRRYQMMYPDEATEAMNLLAQAFVCLTDPTAKKVYDLGLGLNGAAAPLAQAAPATQAAPTAEAAEDNEPVVVLYTPAAGEAAPPPVRVPYGEATPPPPVALIVPEAAPAEVVPAGPRVPPPPPTRRDARRALYRRLAKLRRLTDRWTQLGKYVAAPQRRLTRPAEAVDFLNQLAGIRALAAEMPPGLGQAGQAGYHVLTLAQLNSVPTFQTLLPQQREVVSRDWNDGLTVLDNQRPALRAEVRRLRRRGLLKRAGRAGARFVKKHPGVVLAGLAGLSLAVVLFRTFVFDWLPRQR